jgi:hypothetical protein
MLRLERHRPDNISYTVHFLVQDTISTTFTADGVQEYTLMISSPKENLGRGSRAPLPLRQNHLRICIIITTFLSARMSTAPNGDT